MMATQTLQRALAPRDGYLISNTRYNRPPPVPHPHANGLSKQGIFQLLLSQMREQGRGKEGAAPLDARDDAVDLREVAAHGLHVIRDLGREARHLGIRRGGIGVQCEQSTTTTAALRIPDQHFVIITESSSVVIAIIVLVIAIIIIIIILVAAVVVLISNSSLAPVYLLLGHEDVQPPQPPPPLARLRPRVGPQRVQDAVLAVELAAGAVALAAQQVDAVQEGVEGGLEAADPRHRALVLELLVGALPPRPSPSPSGTGRERQAPRQLGLQPVGDGAERRRRLRPPRRPVA